MRSSTQILIMSTFWAASSATAARPASAVLSSVRDALVGCRARSGVGRPDAAPGMEQPRAADAAGRLVQADLRGNFSWVDALRQHRRHAEIVRALQVLDHPLARVVLARVAGAPLKPGMRVRVEQRGDDRLAGQIHASGAGGNTNRPCRTHLAKASALDQQHAALDRRTAVARDHARVLVRDDIRGRLGQRGARGQRYGDPHGRAGQDGHHGRRDPTLRQRLVQATSHLSTDLLSAGSCDMSHPPCAAGHDPRTVPARPVPDRSPTRSTAAAPTAPPGHAGSSATASYADRVADARQPLGDLQVGGVERAVVGQPRLLVEVTRLHDQVSPS